MRWTPSATATTSTRSGNPALPHGPLNELPAEKETPIMKIFVTGHTGYIGVHLVELLKQSGHTVTGCDLGLFDGCAWEEVVPADRNLWKDVRHITLADLAGHDCVMHLAAISNDPMGEVDA